VRTKNKATKQMRGERLDVKYKLAQGGQLWGWRELLELWYMAAAPEKHYGPRLERQLRDRAWLDLAYLIRVAYERKDGRAFHAIADAFEQRAIIVDPIREYVFFRLLMARDCENGKLPTQADIRQELVKMGREDDDNLRVQVARACKDSELTISRGKPGPKGNNS
jgi:hypothetical protein